MQSRALLVLAKDTLYIPLNRRLESESWSTESPGLNTPELGQEMSLATGLLVPHIRSWFSYTSEILTSALYSKRST